MKILILSANLGNFDTPVNPVSQVPPKIWTVDYHCFTDEDFPPIADLPPRFQYRIPKLFGWQMLPDYDIYIWLDGSMTLTDPLSVKWFIDQLGSADIALFRHPWRRTIKEETDHIEEYLAKGNKYLTPRYGNGLHKEQYAEIKADKQYLDDHLFTSTAFVYRNNARVHEAMQLWWYYQSRYYTVDQIALPYVVYKCKLKVNTINENQFKIPYITLASKH